MPKLLGRKKKKTIKTGPVTSKDGIPLDYIVIIDAGSKASRVYVYNWLNPQYALQAGIDIASKPTINLDRRMLILVEEKDTHKNKVPDTESESDSDSESTSESETTIADDDDVRFPVIHSKSSWHRKMSPGIANFNESPGKVGNHHLSYLLSLASSVVPKSEHYRTPIFLHATAGMRLLPPNQQEPILENVCQYLQSNSDFYLPDCSSHVNIIDGDTEGLYGWLAINYMMNALDHPEKHDHGKGHTTYGLLDMGGASTQVVFQPNQTEKDDHSNNLYHLLLAKLPPLFEDKSDMAQVGNYLRPSFNNYDVYSDSFLGFGMLQAHDRYLKVLLDHYRVANDLLAEVHLFRTPIPDPCLPRGYTTSAVIDDHKYDFVGESNFDACLESIFPVLQNATHGSGTNKDTSRGDCKLLNDGNSVSSCLLNDLIPAFDFDVNHFVGVSGYWDAMNHFLDSGSMPNMDNSSYDYTLIYSRTRELCSQPLQELLLMNSIKGRTPLPQDDLMELCFKSSWILNFLHVGLGFPRFGIDEIPNKDDKFDLLQVVEKVEGLKFTWTMGRAVLYANDEYVQAYNNYSIQSKADAADIVPRPGYYYTAAVGSFYFGAESEGVLSRPEYSLELQNTRYTYYSYETSYKQGEELKWYIKPHRFYGQLIFVFMIIVTILLMVGKDGRGWFIQKMEQVLSKILPFLRQGRLTGYTNLGTSHETISAQSLELEAFPTTSPKSGDADEEFAIGSGEED